jgi:hypothetical protein
MLLALALPAAPVHEQLVQLVVLLGDQPALRHRLVPVLGHQVPGVVDKECGCKA